MHTPVPIKKGDLILINITTGTLWVSEEAAPEANSYLPIPTMKIGQRHCPIAIFLEGKKGDAARNVAVHLAYVVSWVAGFYAGEIMEHYQPSKDTFVFRVI